MSVLVRSSDASSRLGAHGTRGSKPADSKAIHHFQNGGAFYSNQQGGFNRRPGGNLATGEASGPDGSAASDTDGWNEGALVVIPNPELAFFIPPDVKDPSRQPDGSTLWVEVTLPGLGAPRPIQLGLERDGKIEPLALR